MGESSGIILGLGISYHNFRFTQDSEQIVSLIKQTGNENVSTTTTATQLEPPINLKAGSGGGSIMFGYQGLSAPFSEMVQLADSRLWRFECDKNPFWRQYRAYNATIWLKCGYAVGLYIGAKFVAWAVCRCANRRDFVIWAMT